MSPALMIRPGLLIALRSAVRGGVQYSRKDLEVEAPADSAAATARWETMRTIADPEEYAKATKCRSAATALIRAVCIPTSFGLLCPADREEALNAAYDKAYALKEEFNATSDNSNVELHLLKGRIAASDEQAVRTINAELSGLVQELTTGIDKLDPAAIRQAADRAKALAGMLSPEREKVVSEAVAAARSAARDIVRRVEKKGEDARIVLADIERGAIESARMAFLDMEEPTAAEPALPGVVVQRFADIDDDDSEAPGTPCPGCGGVVACECERLAASDAEVDARFSRMEL